MDYKLVQVETPDDFILSGLYSQAKDSKTAAVLIHGFTGDFYTHKFIPRIQAALLNKHISSVTAQNRGTGIHSEIVKKNREDSLWIGSFYEKLSEAHLDISAWIEFLIEEGNEEIILIGHSLGTIKAVRYLFEGKYADKVVKLVLLAPFDKNGYMENHSPGTWRSNVQIAKQKVDDGMGEEIIPENFEDYKLSYQTFVSWYENTDLSNMFDFYRYGKYEFPTLNNVDIPVQIIVGDKDEFFYIPEISSIEDAKSSLLENIKDIDLNIVEGAGHSYLNYENVIVENVSRFI